MASEHDADAVVGRLAGMLRMWMDAARTGEAISSIADPDVAVITLCLTHLKPGDRLPGGLVVVPAEPWHFLAVCKEMLSPENADKYFGANPSVVEHERIAAEIAETRASIKRGARGSTGRFKL